VTQALEQVVERERPGTKRDEAERHRRPWQMEIRPSVGNDELDHTGHDEQAQRGEARAQSQHQHDRQYDLGNTGDVGCEERHRDIIDAAENMKLELLLEQIGSTLRQRQEAVPASEARSEEWQRKRNAKHERGDRARQPSKELR